MKMLKDKERREIGVCTEPHEKAFNRACVIESNELNKLK